MGNAMTKNNDNIKTSDISVVVQGAVDPINTVKCLKSIRKNLPDAEIILSTWKGTDVSGLDYDEVILNDDPGYFNMSPCEKNNVKRQILSTLNGLKKATRKYALKIRSDIELTNNSFFKYFDKFNDYNPKWHFLERRIIIPSMITRDPRIWESPMCPSDWCSFGLKSDMLKLWDIKLPTQEEEKWFLSHPRPEIVSSIYPTLEARFNPEQFIWIGFVKKYIQNLHTDHMFDINPNSIEETLLSFANNLIILSENQFGIRPLKPARKNSDRWHVITFNDFLKIYNKFANGHKFIFPFDFQRLYLYKYFKKSNSRLFKRAKQQHKISTFLKKEFKYASPILYCLANPLISFIKKYEKKIKPELWWFVNEERRPNFSIVIPAHGNLSYIKQTLDCLKQQTYRDFEVIISDDSIKLKERKEIKKMLLQLREDCRLDIKYIFSEASLGQSKNTNQGLNHIRGKWVRILHSDDLLSPSVLKDEYNLIQSNPNVVALFHNTVEFENNINYSLADTQFSWAFHSAEFIIEKALHTHCPVPSSLLFRADIMQDIGKFNPAFCRACDWDFWSRIVLFALKHKNTLCHIQDKNVFYRIHKTQNTNKKSTKLKNYEEYLSVSNKVSQKLSIDMTIPKIVIDYYEKQCLIYRKQRLINDYFSLPFIWKIRYFKKFKKLLVKGM